MSKVSSVKINKTTDQSALAKFSLSFEYDMSWQEAKKKVQERSF